MVFPSRKNLEAGGIVVSDQKDRLLEYCKAFIKEQRITCPETIGQCDWVILNAYAFIEGVCDIVGYAETEDEEGGE
ncbi:hypothetical protein [Bradyrhizobium sp. SZCCHNR3118]|uniref:hypothetical protein n=1 Tax=Bradyrhizobium sp. SZCCHNR3118 TaxID=3057468 RepID=UPI0029168113|nr:hypothetical protein [Bradyrhizobium sp. SZCCHNR3118]